MVTSYEQPKPRENSRCMPGTKQQTVVNSDPQFTEASKIKTMFLSVRLDPLSISPGVRASRKQKTECNAISRDATNQQIDFATLALPRVYFVGYEI